MKYPRFFRFASEIFQSTQKYNKNTTTTMHPAAAFTYIDLVLRYVASFLYFWERIERF